MSRTVETHGGSNVIFIACQPRSGSTMLQRMLGGHDEIYTTSEPWVMLPGAFSLRDDGRSRYNSSIANKAIESFSTEALDGREEYIRLLRNHYTSIYNRALENRGETYFLDKTPRYYYILKEIEKILPNSKIILLVRNPVSVLSSIINRWVGNRWLNLKNFKDDIFRAPKNIAYANKNLKNTTLVRYEDLIVNTEKNLGRILQFCGLPEEEGLKYYGDESMDEWRLGDKNMVYEKNKPVRSTLGKWKNVSSAQEWRVLWDYANKVDKKVIKEFGYNIDKIKASLNEIKPKKPYSASTIPLNFILEDIKVERRFRKHYLSILDILHKKGITGASAYVVRKVYSFLQKIAGK